MGIESDTPPEPDTFMKKLKRAIRAWKNEDYFDDY